MHTLQRFKRMFLVATYVCRVCSIHAAVDHVIYLRAGVPSHDWRLVLLWISSALCNLRMTEFDFTYTIQNRNFEEAKKRVSVLHKARHLSGSGRWSQQLGDSVLGRYRIYWGVRGSVVVEALCCKPGNSHFRYLMKWIIFFFNLPNPFSRTRLCSLLRLLTEISIKSRKMFLWVERGRCVTLTQWFGWLSR
jgi:hypothetical protein